MERIRVLLANHHPIVRNELRSLLERDSQIQVVGEAANGREALQLIEYLQPQVVILDVDLQIIRGLVVARTVSSKYPDIRTLFVSALSDQTYIDEALRTGAYGYVLEDMAQKDLLSAVSAAAAGAKR